MPYAYKKSERLRKNSEFAATMNGKRLSVDGLSLFYAERAAGGLRVGIAVSRKLGNAVVRNRMRRKIRGCIMRILQDQTPGCDMVFMPRRELLSADNAKIMKAVATALQRAATRTRKQESPSS